MDNEACIEQFDKEVKELMIVLIDWLEAREYPMTVAISALFRTLVFSMGEQIKSAEKISEIFDRYKEVTLKLHAEYSKSRKSDGTI